MRLLIFLLHVGAIALWVWASVDSVRRRRSYWWIAVACSGPFLLYFGSAAYLLNFAILPLIGRKPLDEVAAQSRRIRELEEAIAINPLPRDVLELARHYLDARRPAEALKILKDLIEERPEDVEGHILAGRALLAIGRLDDAERHLRYAVDEDPAYGNGEGPLRLAVVVGAKGRLEEAEQMLLDVYHRYRRPEAVVLAARSLASRGRDQEARDLLHDMLDTCTGKRWLDQERDVPWLAEARRDLKELP